MYKLIILADDFTGALDTGVQFADAGIETHVSAKYRAHEEFEVPPQVLVVNLESRRMKPKFARELVREISYKDDAEYYYKKTDSALRGNIGAELEGLYRGGGALAFVPAYPAAGRTTINGVHYSDGIPISRTVFGEDPFEPVVFDYIPDIIALQSKLDVHVVTRDTINNLSDMAGMEGILVFDTADELQLSAAAKAIGEIGPPRFMAGCAGFAGYLPQMLELKKSVRKTIKASSMLVVLSGSINTLTLNQVSAAAKAGIEAVELTPEEKLNENPYCLRERILEKAELAYKSQRDIIIQAALGHDAVEETERLARQMGLTKDDARQRIASNIGFLAKSIAKKLGDITLAIFGGDTLAAVMHHLGADTVTPLAEIEKGVVMCAVKAKHADISVITKSGGFGGKDVIMKISEYIKSR